MSMDRGLDDVGVKELGRFNLHVGHRGGAISGPAQTKHDLQSELTIELDGISELTRIDPTRFLKTVKLRNPAFGEIQRGCRKQVFSMTNYSLSNEKVDAIVDSMVALNLLRELVYDAKGYEQALAFACAKFGVPPGSLAVRADVGELTITGIGDREKLKEATRLIMSFYGPSRLTEYSIFMIWKIGRFLAVEDSFGRVVGVVDVIFDRWGDTYIHPYCVAKSFRGAGVASMILDAVEDNSRGAYMWSTRTLNFVYNITWFLEKGYAGRYFIRDRIGNDGHRVVFEKRIRDAQPPFRADPRNIPHIERLEGDVDVFATSVENDALLEEAMNRRNYEIVQLITPTHEEVAQSYTVVLRKTDMPGNFKSRDYGFKLPPRAAGGFRPALLQAEDEIAEVVAFQESISADPRENYRTTKVMSYIGLVIGLREGDGGLAAFTMLMWDGSDGLFCHALMAGGDGRGPAAKEALLDYVIGLAEDLGKVRLRLVSSIEEMGFLRYAVNSRGFAATEEYLNPFENGQNYLLLERHADAPNGEQPPSQPDLPVWHSMMEISGRQRGLVSARNYGLTASALEKGYAVTGVVERKDAARGRQNPSSSCLPGPSERPLGFISC
jgi:hypothetical protein